MNEDQEFKIYLRDRMHAQNLTVEELAEASGVGESQIEALLKGEFKKLPAAPYVRGYLIHIANALSLPEEDLWARYKNETEIRSSGARDLLPTNRFAIKTINRGWIIGSVVALLLIIYLGVSATRLFGTPSLTLDYPLFEETTTLDPVVTLRGTITPDDKLTIDGKDVAADSQGHFSLDYTLQQGPNNFIEFRVKRLLGKEITLKRQIIYEPVATSSPKRIP